VLLHNIKVDAQCAVSANSITRPILLPIPSTHADMLYSDTTSEHLPDYGRTYDFL